ETQFVQKQATIRTGDFPGELQITSDGTRLFAPIRGTNSYLLWLEIKDLENGRVDLQCNSDSQTGCGSVDPGVDCPEWHCDEYHQVDYSDRLQSELPAEPFGILLHELVAVHVQGNGSRKTCRDGVSQVPCDCGSAPQCMFPDDGQALSDCCIEAPQGDHIYVAHLLGGEVSYFNSTVGGVELRDFKGGLFATNAKVKGGFSIVPSLPGDARSPVFVSSRSDSSLASFVIRDDERIIDAGSTWISVVSPGNDVRGIAFSPGGDRLYVVDRLPPVLVAMDMTDEGGTPRRDPLWAVELCAEPSLLRLAQDPIHPDDPTALLAYVVCYGEAQVYVIDTTLGDVVAHIFTGKGPHAFVLDEPNQRAFVANFLDNTVGVIDLNPSHRTYQTMVLRIGLPTKLERE
ncbi:MAG: hypothetical protein V1754_08665, partial [Pseudomonadota bacterium]